MDKVVFLTFDVEEFDLPLEYNQIITLDEQMQVGFAGLKAIKPLLNESFIETTLFTTANFAQHFPEDIKQLSIKHEIASHTFYHSNFKDEDLLLSKQKLEEITGKKIVGLRMPRLRKVDLNEVAKADYQYDSSINPTYLPGRYNNLNLPKIIYTENNIIRVPTAVTPNFRIPLFWLAFKNIPYYIYKQMALQALKKYGYLSLYFHPWEFVDISQYNLPYFTKKPCGARLLEKMYRLVNDLKQEAEFVSIENYLTRNNSI
jgi:peptidoglycan/xylan/chitin deacetylase (PgdA/CDA1 family)